MVSLLNFVHYSTESEAAHRKTGFRGGARRKWRIGENAAKMHCTAPRRRRATAAITPYLHLYSNKLTRRWWWDGPTECSPNTLNLHARGARKPCKHLNSICVCVCRFFSPNICFVSRGPPPIFGGISSAFSHTGGTWFTSPRCAAVSSCVLEFCLMLCATTRIRFLQINFWLGPDSGWDADRLGRRPHCSCLILRFIIAQNICTNKYMNISIKSWTAAVVGVALKLTNGILICTNFAHSLGLKFLAFRLSIKFHCCEDRSIKWSANK
jgi:hypothetical protein